MSRRATLHVIQRRDHPFDAESTSDPAPPTEAFGPPATWAFSALARTFGPDAAVAVIEDERDGGEVPPTM